MYFIIIKRLKVSKYENSLHKVQVTVKKKSSLKLKFNASLIIYFTSKYQE